MADYINPAQRAARDARQAPLSGKTQQQARDWINDNVTDLTTAKEKMADIAAMMVILQKQIDYLRGK
ncbi:MAG TPA: hypothetical protein ENI05_09405 [Porticoccus sp.]|nr:hypothetical protein [Porticoccus sp.]